MILIIFLPLSLSSVTVDVVVEDEGERTDLLFTSEWISVVPTCEGLLHVGGYDGGWELGVERLVLKYHQKGSVLVLMEAFETIESSRAQLQPAKEAADVWKPRPFSVGLKAVNDIFLCHFLK